MTQHSEEIASLLPIWDTSIPDIPPRSRLYNLAPLGLNSSFVESLTSYIYRLAHEHHVEVGRLIQYSIASILGKRYIADDKSRSISSFLRYTSPINGNGIMASDWVSALKSLTLRADLALLTLLVGANALSQRDLLQPIRQWCPHCYDTWRSQGAIVYDPLLWSINGVRVCPRHCRFLEKCCPHCSAPQPLLSWSSLPGHCSSCCRWLGSSSGNSQIEGDAMYTAEIVGDFLASVPQLSFPIPRARIIQSLQELVATTTGGNIAEFSRKLGLPKTTTWELVRGRFAPSLPFLLQLCYRFRLSLLQLLNGIESTIDCNVLATEGQIQRRDSRHLFDHKKVQQTLKGALAGRPGATLSMLEVARQLGYPVRTIETHYPVLCQEISRRYAVYRKQRGQLRKALLQIRIHRAARATLSQGLNPTYRRVGAVLGDPGCFREFEARRALLDIRDQPDKEIAIAEFPDDLGQLS